jgi:excisionase family DNA binding protein
VNLKKKGREMIELCTRKEAAEALRVSKMWVLRRIKDGTLPAVKIGRDWKIRADVIEGIQQNGLDLEESE